ncbi:extracellular solute-binding protein [Dongia soli]|uniref:Uncharacterized protein n=1 Tax=Dongia soli TaxID=600628 RepID=A0ABU5EAC3_9PROT|nr:extracellular solute-binding protein [Dongia soli]MDY0883302.1 hypothetical protein [Dongia soli]
MGRLDRQAQKHGGAEADEWDVVDVEPGHALQGCDEGWLEPIDYGALGGRDQFVEGAAMDCALATIVFDTIYAYDAGKFPNGGPKTVADFWDVKKFPGPRALRKSPRPHSRWP